MRRLNSQTLSMPLRGKYIMHWMHVSSLSYGGRPHMCGIYLHVKERKHASDTWYTTSPLRERERERK